MIELSPQNQELMDRLEEQGKVRAAERARESATLAAFVVFLKRLEREVSEPLQSIAADTLHSIGIVD